MQGKSDTDIEYWRSKMNNPVRADQPEPQTLEVVRDRLPAAVVFSTLMLCVTAILVAIIAKV